MLILKYDTNRVHLYMYATIELIYDLHVGECTT